MLCYCIVTSMTAIIMPVCCFTQCNFQNKFCALYRSVSGCAHILKVSAHFQDWSLRATLYEKIAVAFRGHIPKPMVKFGISERT